MNQDFNPLKSKQLFAHPPKAAQRWPVYSLASRVDGCNFSTSTVWEGSIQEGMHYVAGENLGYQFIAEASKLHMILSANMIFCWPAIVLNT